MNKILTRIDKDEVTLLVLLFEGRRYVSFAHADGTDVVISCLTGEVLPDDDFVLNRLGTWLSENV